ncbi:hypothetical protein OKA06_18165 [Novosphingobium sp. MW5]|nr:hypothetical protein [Novosphingobium sp. MW5]
MLGFSIFLAAGTSAIADERLARMAALYEDVCLKAFPDDKAVVDALTALGAKELSQAEVKVTMNDDPARGWSLPDGNGTVWLEFPPFHSCSVRWNSPDDYDLKPYRAIAAKYQAKRPGFSPMQPMEMDRGDIHIMAIGEARQLPDKSAESMFIFRQHITNLQRRGAGETGVSLRFVHQFAPPEK